MIKAFFSGSTIMGGKVQPSGKSGKLLTSLFMTLRSLSGTVSINSAGFLSLEYILTLMTLQ